MSQALDDGNVDMAQSQVAVAAACVNDAASFLAGPSSSLRANLLPRLPGADTLCLHILLIARCGAELMQYGMSVVMEPLSKIEG